MPRRAAAITQADVARALRAAKQAGAAVVEIRPDGTIHILLQTKQEHGRPAPVSSIDQKRKIVL